MHLKHETKSGESTKRTRKKEKKKKKGGRIQISSLFPHGFPLLQVSSVPGRAGACSPRFLSSIGSVRDGFRILSGRSRDAELKDKLGANAKALECLGRPCQVLAGPLSRRGVARARACTPRSLFHRRRRRLSRCPPRRSRIAISPFFHAAARATPAAYEVVRHRFIVPSCTVNHNINILVN